MQVNVAVDTRRWDRFVEKAPKRLAYAVVTAGNKTLHRMRDAVHAHVRSRVKIRAGKDRFWFGSGSPTGPGGVAGRIEKGFSIAAGRAFGEIAISPPTSQASNRGIFLAELEAGGVKEPLRGRKSLAAPLTGRPARPSFAGPVPPAYTFKGLKFRGYVRGRRAALTRRRRGRTVNETVFGEFGRVRESAFTQQVGDKRIQWKGEQRTFILGKTEREPEGAVFQRFGPERGDIREIYSFEKQAPLPDVLEWERTATDTANAWFDEELERQLTEQILRART